MPTDTAARRTARPPSLFWTLTEGRAIIELATFGLFSKRMRRLPKGDGHPVLTLPGFMAGDQSTVPMRRLLKDLGYNAYGWGLGRNMRFNAAREVELTALIDRIYDDTGEKISIIGWSLGGVFARELARGHPGKVRSVISLGSPISNNRNYSSASRLFEAINGKKIDPKLNGRYDDLESAPPVPTTSILTKSDGVVAWRASIQHAQPGAKTENIIVPASHTGLGVNPLVMVALADRLAQPEGQWKPFDRSGWRARFFQTV